MEYQGTDEATRKAACERLKQIIKAITAIKIKYYMNFSKISVADRETYQRLEKAMNKISKDYDLNNLKAALMEEVSAKYDDKDSSYTETGRQNEPDDLLKSCRGAIDAEIDALSRGRITQALRCQDQLKQYMQGLDEIGYQEIITYQRSKLEVLALMREKGLTKKQVEVQQEDENKKWTNANMKGTCKLRLAQQRREAIQLIENLSNREKTKTMEEQGDAVRI